MKHLPQNALNRLVRLQERLALIQEAGLGSDARVRRLLALSASPLQSSSRYAEELLDELLVRPVVQHRMALANYVPPSVDPEHDLVFGELIEP